MWGGLSPPKDVGLNPACGVPTPLGTAVSGRSTGKSQRSAAQTRPRVGANIPTFSKNYKTRTNHIPRQGNSMLK